MSRLIRAAFIDASLWIFEFMYDRCILYNDLLIFSKNLLLYSLYIVQAEIKTCTTHLSLEMREQMLYMKTSWTQPTVKVQKLFTFSNWKKRSIRLKSYQKICEQRDSWSRLKITNKNEKIMKIKENAQLKYLWWNLLWCQAS